ncbi:MAG: hypothetical protein J1E06_11500 [Acutalibacter sp.]|nr:hypothetical protein [Acutalibacter sp.]
MKSPEEFRKSVYEKQVVKEAARKHRRKQAMVCVPLAFLIVLGSVFLPRVFTGENLPFLRSGRIPLMLQVGRPADPTKQKLFDAVNSEADEQTEKITGNRYSKETTPPTAGWVKEEIDPAFSESVNRFARDSAMLLSKDFEENACYSPLSMYYAMALTGCGAGGKTKEEFQNVLYAEDRWAAEQCRKFYVQHYSESETDTFRLENSLWLDGRYAFGDQFISYAENDFFSSLFQVDYSDPTLSGEMTKWVSEQTDGQLSPAFTFEDHQMLYLMNTILYEAQWDSCFLSERNTQEDFHKADGSTVTAEFMHQTLFTRYYRGNGYTGASLPLKNGDRMVFVLPDLGVSTGELLSDPALFEKMLFGGEPDETTTVHWSIPKFDFTCEYDLQNTLKGMGMELAYDPVLADFSEMGKLEMYLSKTSQTIHIGVGENGISVSKPETYREISDCYGIQTELVLDRPFLFAVLTGDVTVDGGNSETLLYVGVCGNPTASGSAGSAAAAS